MRGFKEVTKKHRCSEGIITLPVRKTIHSAGYDFFIPQKYDGITLKPGEKITMWTDVKANMNDGEYLSLHIRSSLGIKHGLALANATGIIDKDYYGNEDNDGNIACCIINTSDKPYTFRYNDCIVQGIFSIYLRVEDDKAFEKRIGGIGSTTKRKG